MEEHVVAVLDDGWEHQAFGNTIMAWDGRMLRAGTAQEHTLFPGSQDAKKHWRNFFSIAVDPKASFAAAEKWFILTTHTVSGSHVHPQTRDGPAVDHRQLKNKTAWDKFKIECVGITCYAATQVAVQMGARRSCSATSTSTTRRSRSRCSWTASPAT